MKKYLLCLLVSCTSICASSQNVGIGNPLPAEKLDVTGNINVTGTIKVNGVDGQANQVLKKDNSGVLVWSDLSQFKNYETFLNSASWTVPPGITKIAVALWGAGGGGSTIGGGGGGGFIMGEFVVTPGASIFFSIGNGGAGAANATSSGADGALSTITIGGNTLTASGGSGAVNNSAGGFYSSGTGGGFSASFSKFMGIRGQNGTATKKRYDQGGTSLFYEIGEMGHGGDGANSVNTAGKGILYISAGAGPIPSETRFQDTQGKVPGGGGGSYLVNSGAGGKGMVMIYY